LWKSFLVPEEDAVGYCCAGWTQVHRDVRKVIKQNIAGQRIEHSEGGGLPRAVVNRIFSLSRAASF